MARSTSSEENVRLYALVLAPAEKVSQETFDRFLADAQAARKAYFLKEHFKFEPKPAGTPIAATEEQRRRGCIVFDRYCGSTLGYRGPARRRRSQARPAAGARGERVPLVVSALALEALKGVKVSVTDLVSESGGAIPAGAVRVAGVRLKLQKRDGSYSLVADVIQEQPKRRRRGRRYQDVVAHRRCPRQLRPRRLPRHGDGRARQLRSQHRPARLTVHPFALAPARMSIGLWYDDPSRLGYNTSLKGGVAEKRLYSHLPDADVAVTAEDNEVEAYRLRMLDADLKSLSEHGFNGITVSTPRLVAVAPTDTTRSTSSSTRTSRSSRNTRSIRHFPDRRTSSLTPS